VSGCATQTHLQLFHTIYDNNGNLISKTDARGINVKYTYDSLNRLVFRKYEGPTDIVSRTPSVTYSYDGVGALGGENSFGKLTSVSSSISTTFYDSYDEVGNIRASRQVTDGVTYPMAYNYDLAGNLVSQMYPSGRIVSTGLDSAGRITAVYGNFSNSSKFYISDVAYAPHGAVEALRLGNGLHEQVRFNSRLQPLMIGLGTSKGDTSLWKLDYDYGTTNNNGNLLTQSITAPQLGTVTQTYTYDPLNRLETAQEKGGANWKQKFIYDRYGNRQIDVANTSTGSVPETPQISQQTNKITASGYSYDSAGNLRTTAIGLTLDYDGENKQVSVNKDGLSSQYGYDGEGKRVRKISDNKATTYVYDAFYKLVGEYTSNSVESSSTHFITQDRIGTIRVLTGQTGSVKERRDYLPFGERVMSRGNFGDTGQNTDKWATYERDKETGLDFAQARYYSPMQGRFTSPDSIGGLAINPQSLNLYGYVTNNPLRYVDPTGHLTQTPKGPIVDPQAYDPNCECYPYEGDTVKVVKNEKKTARAGLPIATGMPTLFLLTIPEHMNSGGGLGPIPGTVVSRSVQRATTTQSGSVTPPSNLTLLQRLRNWLFGVPATPAPASQSPAITSWPPNDGFLFYEKVTLQPGTIIDRYGAPTGRFTAPYGTPFEMRSMPPKDINKELHVYEVLKPLEVKAGPALPWFGQPGLGTQYEFPRNIQRLAAEGYLREISP
jgi:RHS repeat-associated protein